MANPPNAQPLAPLVARLGPDVGHPVQAAMRAQDNFNVSTQSALAAILAPPVWVELTATNGWSYWGAPFNTPAYYVDWTGRVWLKGLVTGGTPGDAMFTQAVPKPAFVQNFSCAGVAGPGQVQIAVNGTVTLVAGSTSVFAALDGLSYLP